MLVQIGQFLVDVVGSFLVFCLLARFHFQWLRVPFRNPVGEFLIAVTNWIVLPARRLVPPAAGLDLATLVAAWLLQALALTLLFALAGGGASALVFAAAAFDLVRYSLYILVFAVIVMVVLSWVNPGSPVAYLFDAITRPFLRPIRRVVPLLGRVDLSPLVLLVLAQVALIVLAHLRTAAWGAL
ncbi:MAG: YggT family protein [Burkholderiales bacterium]